MRDSTPNDPVPPREDSVPEFDVAVLGAGIQGAGAAQAAAAAGHSVLVLERSHPAAGTSSRSSKLIHGGLRYLESGQLGLVRESLTERKILLRIAPHLVRLVPFHVPVYRSTSRSPWTIRAGLSLYALLAGLRRTGRFESLPKRDWQSLDGLRTDGLRAVFRYLDGQTDDAALCRAVVRSARDLGAEVHLGAEFEAARRDGDGVRITWRDSDSTHVARARVVVNATGPWANRVNDRAPNLAPQRPVDLVGGTHIEVPGTLERGIYYAEAPSDGRAVFTIPWRDRVMVGTTEEPFDGDPARVTPTEREIEYLLGIYRHYFPSANAVERDDVLDAWAGLRVLPRAEGSAFHRPREVILLADDPDRPHWLTIYGGKLTGYRHTGERIARMLRRSLGEGARRADTATLRLPDDPES